jgi:hypothetical protein
MSCDSALARARGLPVAAAWQIGRGLEHAFPFWKSSDFGTLIRGTLSFLNPKLRKHCSSFSRKFLSHCALGEYSY